MYCTVLSRRYTGTACVNASKIFVKNMSSSICSIFSDKRDMRNVLSYLQRLSLTPHGMRPSKCQVWELEPCRHTGPRLEKVMEEQDGNTCGLRTERSSFSPETW
jgi:hypothetical protein